MRISLLEPLGISEKLIKELAQPLIEAGHQFDYFTEKTTNPEELYERSKDSDIVIIANNPYPAEVINRLEKTKLINVAFTGVDHVDLSAAKAKGIKVANASGYSAQAVPELAIGLTLALYRSLLQGDRDIRKAEDFPGLVQGREIKGKTVGIVGTGSLGVNTARLFKAFGANLVGYNRSKNEEALNLGLEYLSLDDLLKQSDIVSVHLPLTDATRGIIGAEELALMKESAVLINVARGPIIDNEALAQALMEDKIAGAGIDVYDTEPPLASDYSLLQAKNTVLAPHVGFLTQEAMVHRAEIVFDNAMAFIDGREKNMIDLG